MKKMQGFRGYHVKVQTKYFRRIILTGFAALSLMPFTGFENAWADSLSPQTRQITAKALQATEKNRWSQARDMVSDTQSSLAAKIYHWTLYTHHPKRKNFAGLTSFIRQNPDWPAIYRLRKKAEKNLPSRYSDRDIIAWFDDYPPLTAHGLDLYVSALLNTGHSDKARHFLGKWWSKTLLDRNDQKYLYGKYNRYISREAHLARLDKMLSARRYSNAKAVARVLGGGYPALAKARIELARNKSGVNGLINAIPASLAHDPGLTYDRLRWRRKHDLDQGAIALLHQASSMEHIPNPSKWWKERHIMVRRLIEDQRYKEAYALASTHIQKSGFPRAQAEWLSGFLALRFIKKPALAYRHFQTLYTSVKTPISKARGAYWSGRAAEAMGNKPDADRWFEEAAQFQTTYYGQMAAAELSMKGTLPNMAPPVLSPSEQKHFNANELIQAARVFHEAGMMDEASDFLMAFIDSEKTSKAYRFAADLSLDLKRFHDAVQIAKDATKEGLFLTAQSYPVVTQYLKQVDVEWALVHALIRQESLFNVNARSPAGARGLMQLMPATAKETARKLRTSHNISWLTSRPDHNVTLGTAYLSHLLERFDGAYPLAIAGYNAGPNRVQKWLKTYGDPRKGEIDIMDWIELIPIYETRNYVQRVVENTYIYRLRLKNIQKKPRVTISMAMPQNLQKL